MALSLTDALSHHREKHSSVDIVFECARCRKSYQTKHAALCHIPKCPKIGAGEPEVEEPKAFSCPECTDTFSTQRGLSQHKRIRHPSTRNAERAALAAPVARAPRDGSSFSAEEITRMYELERIYKGDPNIVQRIVEDLRGKILKQIRDKRREPAYCRRRDQLLKDAAKLLPPIRRRTRVSLLSESSTSSIDMTRKSSTSLHAPINACAPCKDLLPPDRSTSAAAGRTDDVFSPRIEKKSESMAGSSRSANISEDDDRSLFSGGVLTRRKLRYPVRDRYVRLERCDGLMRPPPLLDSSVEIVTDEEAEWKEELRSCFGEWNSSEYPRDALEVCDAIREAINDLNENSVEAAYASIIKYLGAEQSSVQAKDRPPRTKKRTKRRLKRYQYARAQDLFKRDPGLLARHV